VYVIEVNVENRSVSVENQVINTAILIKYMRYLLNLTKNNLKFRLKLRKYIDFLTKTMHP
jgi:hypothetical protein